MSPGKLVDEKDVGCQDKSGPGKIHEVILVFINLWVQQNLSSLLASLPLTTPCTRASGFGRLGMQGE